MDNKPLGRNYHFQTKLKLKLGIDPSDPAPYIVDQLEPDHFYKQNAS